MYECPSCPRVFRQVGRLRNHQVSKHQREQCDSESESEKGSRGQDVFTSEFLYTAPIRVFHEQMEELALSSVEMKFWSDRRRCVKELGYKQVAYARKKGAHRRASSGVASARRKPTSAMGSAHRVLLRYSGEDAVLTPLLDSPHGQVRCYPSLSAAWAGASLADQSGVASVVMTQEFGVRCLVQEENRVLTMGSTTYTLQGCPDVSEGASSGMVPVDAVAWVIVEFPAVADVGGRRPADGAVMDDGSAGSIPCGQLPEGVVGGHPRGVVTTDQPVSDVASGRTLEWVLNAPPMGEAGEDLWVLLGQLNADIGVAAAVLE
jgi:hypothetical protein